MVYLFGIKLNEYYLTTAGSNYCKQYMYKINLNNILMFWADRVLLY